MAYSGNRALPGLQPITNGKAGTVPRVRHYVVSATYATTIAEGCIAIKGALGVTMETASASPGDGTVVGVFAQNRAALDSRIVKVAIYDDPEQEFACIQNKTITSTQAIEYIGQFTGVISNTYNATLGSGKAVLNTTGAVTSVYTTTNCMQILGVVTNTGDDTGAVNSQLIVKFAPESHIFTASSTTARPT